MCGPEPFSSLALQPALLSLALRPVCPLLNQMHQQHHLPAPETQAVWVSRAKLPGSKSPALKLWTLAIGQSLGPNQKPRSSGWLYTPTLTAPLGLLVLIPSARSRENKNVLHYLRLLTGILLFCGFRIRGFLIRLLHYDTKEASPITGQDTRRVSYRAQETTIDAKLAVPGSPVSLVPRASKVLS